MKISKQQLTKMVNEEIQQMVDEGFFGKIGHKMGFKTGETRKIDSLLMQVARALEEATGEYGLDLDYESDPVQAVNDFVDRIGGLFMRAGLPEKDFAKAKDLMMQGRGEAGANIMYQHFTGMVQTEKGEKARNIIAMKLRDIGEEIGKAEEILRIKQILHGILATHCKRSLEDLERDTDRDNFMSATEAATYGLVDEVVSKVS